MTVESAGSATTDSMSITASKTDCDRIQSLTATRCVSSPACHPTPLPRGISVATTARAPASWMRCAARSSAYTTCSAVEPT